MEHAPTGSGDGGRAAQLDRRPPGDVFDLLAGIRVLDLTTSLAGPYAAMLLADLGAEVVKVERPGAGDDARHWGPPFLDGDGLWFMSVNRNKRSLALDYANVEGRQVLERLLDRADVLIVNLRPSVQRKLGLDSETLQPLHPRLVHCSITGFGLTGPNAELPCYDLVAEGYSGVMELTGAPESGPQKIGAPAADLLAGMDSAFAVVAALFDRQRTGKGHAVDVSLVESMTRFMGPRIVPAAASGEYPRRTGARDSVIAIYQVFDTADGEITLGLGNDRIFQRFCEAVGRPEWVREERYSTNARRRAVREELVGMIQEVLRQRTRREWLELFLARGVPAGPINGLESLLEDPHLRERGLFYAIPSDRGPIPQVGSGWRLDGRPNGYASPPPRLGEHSEEVLSRWLADD